MRGGKMFICVSNSKPRWKKVPMFAVARGSVKCCVRLGSGGPHHSVLRVGVLGCFRPIVLHSQPAKSTSSTSDRLINVWFWKKTRAGLSAAHGYFWPRTDVSHPPAGYNHQCIKDGAIKQIKGLPNTHHQIFQDCSFRRVFDQTAHTQGKTES